MEFIREFVFDVEREIEGGFSASIPTQGLYIEAKNWQEVRDKTTEVAREFVKPWEGVFIQLHLIENGEIIKRESFKG